MPRLQKINLTDEVRDVLARSAMTTDTLTLPDQLERKLYDATMKAIAAVGGKWNRGRMCHVFERDPREALGLAIETGAMVDKKKTFQAFFTPLAIARSMADRFCALHQVTRGTPRVLEPSAGSGRLAREARAIGAQVLCVEIQPDLARDLRAEFPVIEGDFLTKKPGANLFDGVLMNPPFTNDQDAEHICHAWKFLKPGGTMLAICSARYTFTSTKKLDALRALITGASDSTVIELPAGTFHESGTGVRTMLLTLTK